jgi:hypothetical protein
VVRYAAILYPGPVTRYTQGLEALHAYPGIERSVEKQIEALLRESLAP